MIAVAVGNSSDLPESPKKSAREKFEALPGIKVDHRIAGPGQDVDETIDWTCFQLPFHPIALLFFPWQELQLMESDGPFLPKTLGAPLDRPITAFVAVGLQSLVGLKNRGGRRFLISSSQTIREIVLRAILSLLAICLTLRRSTSRRCLT